MGDAVGAHSRARATSVLVYCCRKLQRIQGNAADALNLPYRVATDKLERVQTQNLYYEVEFANKGSNSWVRAFGVNEQGEHS